MADIKRKVLINRHSSKAEAPIAKDMYLGEIAVSHPAGNLSATTIYTKNDDVMVPFASCAMTMSMINNAIDAANVTYDVKAKDGDAHVTVEVSGEKEKVFTVSSKNVQSKTEFEAYSSKTTNALDTLTKSFSDLLDVTLTAGTGDDIITVSTASTDTSANTFSVTHTKAPKAITADFNKLATDAYGHVTGATAVEAIDIKNLGFENSAWTKEQINSAIEALDKTDDVAVDGQYVAAIEETNGVVAVKTRANVSDAVLNGYAKGTDATAVASTDSINVAISKLENQVDKAIASSDDLNVVSGIVDTFSAATVEKITSAFTYVNDKINALDVETVSGAGQAITAISQTDGKISAVAGDIAAAHVTVADADGKLEATTVEAALAELADKAKAITIKNDDKSINVTPGVDGTVINVNIKSDEKVIKLGDKGLYTNLNLVKITESLPATVKERYEFRDSDNNKIGEPIDIAKDSHIVSITYNKDTQKLIYEYIDASGATKTTEVDMGNLVLETEVENGIQAVEGVLSIKLDAAGDDTGVDKFLSVGPDGLKLNGVSKAIKAAVNDLDVTDAAAAGQYVSSVSETDGKIAVSRANVSDAVLNGYVKGEKPAETAIAATDDVKSAIAKLEHQIDATKAAATTKVAKDTNANHLTLTPSTAGDGSVTYTIGESDIASKVALDDEIAARKAVDGQTGQTYVANTGVSYIADATSLNDADVKLDVALKAANDAITAETKAREDAIAALDSTGQTTGNGYFLTSVQIADGKITAVTQSDKVNSASSADKVVNTLTMRDATNSQAFDGSAARSLTFGTSVTATGLTDRSSMSMDANGVVDVEIIDCGTY